MKDQKYPETVSEAINDLIKRGYTTDFSIHSDNDSLIHHESAIELSPEEFEIDETFRFEGNTDPGDEMIVFAISSKKHNLKGIVVNAYGMYSDSNASRVVERLKNHVEKVEPIKRSEYLKSLSREHHHSLLLCWKIKVGFSKEVSAERIHSYALWFYKKYLEPHFELEEKYVFPILGMQNEGIKKAIQDHRLLTSLFLDTKDLNNSLKQIQIELEKHIRFEERMLFNQIQQSATEAQLQEVQKHHVEEKFHENNSDVFWK